MFISDKIFPLSLVLMSLFSGLTIFIITRQDASTRSAAEKFPRNRLFGTMLGAFVLLWCAKESEPLVPDSMRVYLIPTALLLTWLGYMFLDFLFSRSLGGLLILLAHYFLFESFALKTPLTPLFPLFCFIMGTFGILISGKPFLLRDLLRKIFQNGKWRLGAVFTLTIYAVFFMSLGVFHFLKR